MILFFMEFVGWFLTIVLAFVFVGVICATMSILVWFLLDPVIVRDILKDTVEDVRLEWREFLNKGDK